MTDRNYSVSEIRRSLSSKYLFGSVVVGKPGMGKSRLLHEVLDGAEDDHRVVHLRGTALSKDLPFGALMFLLDEVDADLAGGQLTAELLSRHFEEKADGGPTVIVIDNADSLDAETADVVAQLVLNRTVKLVMACRDLGDCPSSLMTLWLEGALLRIDLDKLSLSEAQGLLCQVLPGRISRSATHSLWEYSAGNARLMHLLVQDFINTAKIVPYGDVWVLRHPSPVRISQPTADATMAHLGPMTDQQNELLEILALAGQMPLALALALGSIEDLDHLNTIEAISLTPGASQQVSVERLVGEVIRERIGPFRRTNHLHRVRAAQRELGSLPIHPVRCAQWTLECGLPLDPVAGLRAVQAANSTNDSDTALRIAAGISGDTTANLPLLVETARAHLAAGNETAAARLMKRFAATAREHLPVEEGIRFEALGHGPAREQVDIARSFMSRLGDGLTGSLAEPSGSAPMESGALLTRAERVAAEGRFKDIRTMMEGREETSGNAGLETELQLKGLLALADAVTDRQHEARDCAESIKAALHSSQISESVRARLMFRLQLIFLITGKSEVERGAALHYPLPVSGDGAGGELMEGVQLAHQGCAEEALALLEPALAQLQLRDPVGLGSVAAAATAYCYALQGNLGKVQPLMLPIDRESSTTSEGLPMFTLRYFRALTLASLGSTPEAITRLRDLADEQSMARHFGLELLARAAAVRMGDKSSARPLLKTVNRTQGPFSELCSLIARGIVDKSPQLLLDAMRTAESMEHREFATKIAGLVRPMAVASGDRALTRQVQRLRVSSEAHIRNAGVEGQLSLLTPREEEVTRLVKAGLGNKEMAARMHVSVRTVEGHLYQVYVKLGVSSRGDLLDALSG